MAGVLYCLKSKKKSRPEFSSIKSAEIKYCWGFISLKRAKYGMAGDLFHWEGQGNVRQGDFFYGKR